MGIMRLMEFNAKKGVIFNIGIYYVVISGGFDGRQFVSPLHMMTFGEIRGSHRRFTLCKHHQTICHGFIKAKGTPCKSKKSDLITIRLVEQVSRYIMDLTRKLQGTWWITFLLFDSDG